MPGEPLSCAGYGSVQGADALAQPTDDWHIRREAQRNPLLPQGPIASRSYWQAIFVPEASWNVPDRSLVPTA